MAFDGNQLDKKANNVRCIDVVQARMQEEQEPSNFLRTLRDYDSRAGDTEVSCKRIGDGGYPST
eukprot:296285-Hanusia_phi.AAC.3